MTWTTANEVNNKGFDIERLMANGDWETLGFVKGNNKGSTYQFTDRRDAMHRVSTTTATDYYRLRQIDNDGKETLSKVISIETKGKSTVKVYPSVTSGFLTIENAQSFEIVNTMGQVVVIKQNLQNLKDFVNLSHLPNGLYLVRGVDTEGSLFSVKIVKEQ